MGWLEVTAGSVFGRGAVPRVRVRVRGARLVVAGASLPGVAPRRAAVGGWLPGDALIELGGRFRLSRRVPWPARVDALGVGCLPPRRAPGGRDPGWCRRRTEVGKVAARGGGGGDEGDDAHRAATGRTHEWEHFIDAGEQQRPGVAGGTTMRRFGRGWIGRWCGCRGRRGHREGSERSVQRCVGREHAAVAVAMDARRRHQSGDAVEQFEGVRTSGPVPPGPSLVRS